MFDLETTEKNEDPGKKTPEAEAPAGENESANDGADDEFEYDDDGNIIIPEVEYETDDDEPIDDEPDDEKGEKNGNGGDDGTDGGDDRDESGEKDDAEPGNVLDERDKKISDLEAELAHFRSVAADALEKLGANGDDVLDGLSSLAAEAEGKSKDDYIKERDERLFAEQAKKNAARAAFAAKMASDLAAVKAAYPEARKYSSVEQFPNFARFGQLRDKGLTPEEAYIASHGQAVKESVAASARQKALNDEKSHLRSNVPVKSSDDGIVMTKGELAQWREMFPDKSDKEIKKLYKETL